MRTSFSCKDLIIGLSIPLFKVSISICLSFTDSMKLDHAKNNSLLILI